MAPRETRNEEQQCKRLARCKELGTQAGRLPLARGDAAKAKASDLVNKEKQ